MNRISEFLAEQGRTKKWLSKQINKSYVVTVNYCSNNTQPSIPTLYKISDALGLEARDLLVRNKDLPKKSKARDKKKTRGRKRRKTLILS